MNRFRVGVEGDNTSFYRLSIQRDKLFGLQLYQAKRFTSRARFFFFFASIAHLHTSCCCEQSARNATQSTEKQFSRCHCRQTPIAHTLFGAPFTHDMKTKRFKGIVFRLFQITFSLAFVSMTPATHSTPAVADWQASEWVNRRAGDEWHRVVVEQPSTVYRIRCKSNRMHGIRFSVEKFDNIYMGNCLKFISNSDSRRSLCLSNSVKFISGRGYNYCQVNWS